MTPKEFEEIKARAADFLTPEKGYPWCQYDRPLFNAFRQDVPALCEALKDAQAKIDRLVSRGIQDLRHENEELQAKCAALEAEVARLKKTANDAYEQGYCDCRKGIEVPF